MNASGKSQMLREDFLAVACIRSTVEKVDLVTFHPTSPWLAYVTRDSVVTVWDYVADQVIYTNGFGGAEEAALQEQLLAVRAAQALNQGDPPPTSARDVLSKSSNSGSVKAVAFMDLASVYWLLAQRDLWQGRSHDGASIPPLGRSRRQLAGRSWLVVACEHKVVAHDLLSTDVVDLPRAALCENKTPVQLGWLLRTTASIAGLGNDERMAATAADTLPTLAVGTSSGAVYLASLEKGKTTCKLAGAHRGAVTAITSLPGLKPGLPDRLVSGAADGSLALWEPVLASGVEREIAARQVIKAHDGALHSLALFPALSSPVPDRVTLRLATTGDDHRVAFWDVGEHLAAGGADIALGKMDCHQVNYVCTGDAPLGGGPNLVLSSLESPALLGASSSSDKLLPLLSLQGLVDPGQKKTPKIYDSAVHPTMGNLVAAATNTGVVLLTHAAPSRPPVVALPHAVMAMESQGSRPGEGRDPAAPSKSQHSARGAQGFTLMTYVNGALWSSAVGLESHAAEGGAEPSVTLKRGGPPEPAIALEQPGCPVLSASPSGRSVAAVWPERRQYAVYTLGPQGAWQLVDQGSGVALAWSSLRAHYAVLCAPLGAVVQQKQRKGLAAFWRGKKDKPEQEQDRLPAPPPTVVLHSLDEAAGLHLGAAPELQVQGTPVALHGGALLGVVTAPAGAGAAGAQESAAGPDASAPSVSAASASAPPTAPSSIAESDAPLPSPDILQLYRWDARASVGPCLPPPLWVGWEPECTQVALGYAETVELCRTRPEFERFASLPLSGTVCGHWQSRQLFALAPGSLTAVFAEPSNGYVECVCLASAAGSPAAAAAAADDAALPLPVQALWPLACAAVAGVRHSYLWLFDALGTPSLVSLRHRGMRLRCLAARGELVAARAMAERWLPAQQHDDVSRVLEALGGEEGAEAALELSGLSPAAEFSLCASLGRWDRAALAFQALVLGVDGDLLKAAAETTLGDEGGKKEGAAKAGQDRLDRASQTVAAILQEDGQSEPEEESGSDSGSEADDESAVDWDAALPKKAESTPALACEDDRETLHLRRWAQRGLRFADAAVAAREQDAARIVLGTLVHVASALPASMLRALVYRLGVCAMTESARVLARAAGPRFPALCDPGVAGPLAALVGGKDGRAMQRVLRAAGLAPVAALQAASWGVGDLEQIVAEWTADLADDEGISVDEVGVAPPLAAAH